MTTTDEGREEEEQSPLLFSMKLLWESLSNASIKRPWINCNG